MRRYQELRGGRQDSSLDAVAHQFGIRGRRSGWHQADDAMRMTCQIAGRLYLVDNEAFARQPGRLAAALGAAGWSRVVWLGCALARLGCFLAWLGYFLLTE